MLRVYNGTAVSIRKAIAEQFLEVPAKKGRWFPIPKLNLTAVNVELENCLPHISVAFEITERAALLLLLRMETVRQNGDGYQFNLNGWESIHSENNLSNSEIEWKGC